MFRINAEPVHRLCLSGVTRFFFSEIHISHTGKIIQCVARGKMLGNFDVQTRNWRFGNKRPPVSNKRRITMTVL